MRKALNKCLKLGIHPKSSHFVEPELFDKKIFGHCLLCNSVTLQRIVHWITCCCWEKAPRQSSLSLSLSLEDPIKIWWFAALAMLTKQTNWKGMLKLGEPYLKYGRPPWPHSFTYIFLVFWLKQYCQNYFDPHQEKQECHDPRTFPIDKGRILWGGEACFN